MTFTHVPGGVVVEYHEHGFTVLAYDERTRITTWVCKHVHLDGSVCRFQVSDTAQPRGAWSHTMATTAVHAAQAYRPDPRYDRAAVLAEVSGHTDQPMHVIEAVLDALTAIGVHPGDWARPPAAPTGP